MLFLSGESLVVEGITPVLMLMAEREGYEVISVEPLVISDDGTDVVVATEGRDRAATWRSVRLELRRRDDGAPVTLDYVRLDLSNGGLRRGSGARALVTGLAHHRVVLKAASHLLQYDTFRTLRDAIVHHAPFGRAGRERAGLCRPRVGVRRATLRTLPACEHDLLADHAAVSHRRVCHGE